MLLLRINLFLNNQRSLFAVDYAKVRYALDCVVYYCKGVVEIDIILALANKMNKLFCAACLLLLVVKTSTYAVIWGGTIGMRVVQHIVCFHKGIKLLEYYFNWWYRRRQIFQREISYKTIDVLRALLVFSALPHHITLYLSF